LTFKTKAIFGTFQKTISLGNKNIEREKQQKIISREATQ
jgi:hypothetical protein